jgi:hypothetical protein
MRLPASGRHYRPAVWKARPPPAQPLQMQQVFRAAAEALG